MPYTDPGLAEPSAVFVYGPFAFVAASCVLSLALTPWSTKQVRSLRARWLMPKLERAPRRDTDADEVAEMFRGGAKPELDRAAGLLVSIVVLWSLSSAAGGLLLLLDGSERAGRLPGDHVDAAVIAHAIPPLSNLAAARIVRRLERDGDGTRWDGTAALEERLVLAARLDPRPDRGVDRLLAHGYRTRAARFASAHPSAAACENGMTAAAEALRGGLLFEMMMSCRNVKGDSAAHAAFKMGDFSRAVGPESESIVSRVTRAPADEPDCVAGGYDIPSSELPICLTIHAEGRAPLRRQLLADAAPTPLYAQRWVWAARADLGEPMDPTLPFTIDPVALVTRPFDAVIDHPIAVYQDIHIGTSANLTPGEAVWVALAIAAERSAMSRHVAAMLLVAEAFDLLEIGDGARDEERSKAACLAAAIALRADDSGSFAAYADMCPSAGPLRALASRLGEEDESITSPSLEAGPAPYVEQPILFRRASESARPLLREWLRERFPSCPRCGFFRELRRAAAVREAAGALGDDALVDEIDPVLARFEAVLLNRSLAISLRAADPASAE